MKTIIAAVVAFTLCSNLIASSVNGTKIKQILVGEVYGNKAFLNLEIKPTLDSGHCVSNSIYSYVFDISTEVGKATLSMALAAHMSQSNVFVNGFDTCTIYSGVENLRQFRLQ